jgi:hypothetical protein
MHQMSFLENLTNNHILIPADISVQRLGDIVSYCGSNVGQIFEKNEGILQPGTGTYQEDVKSITSASDVSKVKSNNFNADASGGGSAWAVQLNASASGGMDLLNQNDCNSSETYMYVYIKKELPMLYLPADQIKLNTQAKKILDTKGIEGFIRNYATH